MQGGALLSEADVLEATGLWDRAMHWVVGITDELTHYVNDEGDEDLWSTSEPLHKSLANRLLEPWMFHTATVTAVDWDGFFHQRSLHHSAEAQPEIAAMATRVEDLYLESDPTPIGGGEWHIPYIRDSEREEFELTDLLKLGVARCARTSYLTHGGLRDVGLDFNLYERLRTSVPAHASPFQHVATPAAWNEASISIDPAVYGLPGSIKNYKVPVLGNARGYIQLRHIEMGF
jgi:hypothetical protein